MKKKGSALRKALVITAVIAVLAGAMFGARAIINRNRSVGVIQVMNIADTWIDYGSQGYGQISQGGIQQVWNDTSMLIQKIYVSEGDRVKKGDPLIQYDTAQAELRADDCRIQYEMARRGSLIPAFSTIVSIGTNAFYLHHSEPEDESGEVAKEGDIIQIDVGAA